MITSPVTEKWKIEYIKSKVNYQYIASTIVVIFKQDTWTTVLTYYTHLNPQNIEISEEFDSKNLRSYSVFFLKYSRWRSATPPGRQHSNLKSRVKQQRQSKLENR